MSKQQLGVVVDHPTRQRRILLKHHALARIARCVNLHTWREPVETRENPSADALGISFTANGLTHHQLMEFSADAAMVTYMLFATHEGYIHRRDRLKSTTMESYRFIQWLTSTERFSLMDWPPDKVCCGCIAALADLQTGLAVILRGVLADVCAREPQSALAKQFPTDDARMEIWA